MVEPIFDAAGLEITSAAPSVHVHTSAGSGKAVNVHVCARCGTRSHLTFERWPDRLGVYSGTFDEPGRFDVSPATSKIIFIGSVRPGTLIPPGFPTYREHAATADGTPVAPLELAEVLHVG
jgi:hypothetical protein